MSSPRFPDEDPSNLMDLQQLEAIPDAGFGPDSGRTSCGIGPASSPRSRAFAFSTDEPGGLRRRADLRGRSTARPGLVAVRLARDEACAASGRLLLFPPGLDFVAAFFGCLYAGVVAVPASPVRPNRPMDRLQLDRRRLPARAWSWPPCRRGDPEPGVGCAAWMSASGSASTKGIADSWTEAGSKPGPALAFLQYTSGSTADTQGGDGHRMATWRHNSADRSPPVSAPGLRVARVSSGCRRTTTWA